MKNILWMMVLLFTLSCTQVTDNPPNDSQEAVILSAYEYSTLELWNSGGLTAIAIDEQGDTLTDVSFIWESSDTNTAVVDSTGRITGISHGFADVTAKYNEITGPPCLVTVLRQDDLYVEVFDDSVTFFHDRTFRNCAFSATMDVQINGDIISIYERCGFGPMANCYCFFDLSVTIADLPPNEYTIEVFGVDDPYHPDDIDYYGSVEFVVEGNANQTEPAVGSQHQSECYTTLE